MPKIEITITTRLQNQGEGLTMLSNESVDNSIPRQRQLFPRRGWHRQTDWSSLLPPTRLCWIPLPSDKSQIPLAKEGSSIQISPTRRLRFISPVESPGRMFQTPNAFITSFHITYLYTIFIPHHIHYIISYTCTQCSHLFQTHNSLITSFHSTRMHTTFASHASWHGMKLTLFFRLIIPLIQSKQRSIQTDILINYVQDSTTSFRYTPCQHSFLHPPNDGIYKFIPDIYRKYNIYKYYQI